VKECGGSLREKKELHLCWIASLKVRKTDGGRVVGERGVAGERERWW
jgi:hypothetical protein